MKYAADQDKCGKCDKRMAIQEYLESIILHHEYGLNHRRMFQMEIGLPPVKRDINMYANSLFEDGSAGYIAC